MNILLRIARRVVNATFFFKIGLKKGRNVDIRRCVFFDRPECVVIGDNSLINYGCSFHIGWTDNAKILIGNNVQIGMNCVFTCVTHELGSENQRAGKHVYRSIIVEDGVWIGASSTILLDVTIAKGCVIAAGSIVTKSTEPNGLYAGVPAKRIKELSAYICKLHKIVI